MKDANASSVPPASSPNLMRIYLRKGRLASANQWGAVDGAAVVFARSQGALKSIFRTTEGVAEGQVNGEVH